MFYTGEKNPEFAEMKGEEIFLSEGVKGMAVLAVPRVSQIYGDFCGRHYWLLLFSHINDFQKSQSEKQGLYRHLSYDLNTGRYFVGKTLGYWGKLNNYDFFIATNEQKQFIKNILKKHDLKFVRALNKLIDR